MTVFPIASSSSGNCFYLEFEGIGVLVDAGVSWRRFTGAMKTAGLPLDRIRAQLITHTHSDHVGGLAAFRKNLPVPVGLTPLSDQKLSLEETVYLRPGTTVRFADAVQVTPFATRHDCPGSIGFRFDCAGRSLGFATDLGTFSPEILEVLSGCETVILESNYEESMLIAGPYPLMLKKRILSDDGHLSNAACAAAIAKLADRGTRRILLAHLSKENNRPDLARAAAEAAAAGKNVTVEVLPPLGETVYEF